MTEDILTKLNHEGLREEFFKYTRRAFEMLPVMDKPGILDIGCGSGGPTIELSRLSDGEIIGIDINKSLLEKMQSKMEKAGLSERVKLKAISLYNTNFPDGKFDILWEEGVLHLLDRKRSLSQCNRLLKPSGYLVMLETIKWMKKNMKKIISFNFRVVDKFLLPEEFWWTNYCQPLEEKIRELKKKYNDPKDIEKLEPFEYEIEKLRPNPKKFDCGFYIFQKIDEKGRI